jgi:hypothetical protein
MQRESAKEAIDSEFSGEIPGEFRINETSVLSVPVSSPAGPIGSLSVRCPA